MNLRQKAYAITGLVLVLNQPVEGALEHISQSNNQILLEETSNSSLTYVFPKNDSQEVPVVPDSTSMALLGIGALVMAIRRRRSYSNIYSDDD